MNTKRISSLVIFLTEDDTDDSELFQDAVNNTGYNIHVIHFEDGKALCEYLEDENMILPDIIFLDINMPLFNGKECLKQIKKNQLYNEASIVILTTSDNPIDITDTFELGADRFIKKPHLFADTISMFQLIFELKTGGKLPNTGFKDFMMKYD